MEKVLITEPIHPDAVAFLARRFQVVQGTGTGPEAIRREGAGCAAILLRVAKISAETMDALPALDRATRTGDFARRGRVTNFELAGKTVGLVGLGRIARLVAAKLAGFGVELVGCDPCVTQAQVEDLGVRVLPMDRVLAQADVLSLHTPLTEQTRHLIGAAELARMKPTAVLVNASRGPVLDEAALCAALRAGELAGAGLDVFEQEPPAADDPLFALDSVAVSPHNAALTDAALRAMAMDSAQGIADCLTGAVPEFLCNPSVRNK